MYLPVYYVYVNHDVTVQVQINEWEKIDLQENVWYNNIKWVICNNPISDRETCSRAIERI